MNAEDAVAERIDYDLAYRTAVAPAAQVAPAIPVAAVEVAMSEPAAAPAASSPVAVSVSEADFFSTRDWVVLWTLCLAGVLLWGMGAYELSRLLL